LVNSFPNIDAAMTASSAELSAVTGDVAALEASFEAALVGSVVDFALAPADPRWLVCDGAELSRTTWATLFAYLGSAFGDGDGTTTFNLPDYRGQFARAQDAAAGNDPDAGVRTDRGDGTVGDAPGTRQLDALQDHTHNYNNISAPGANSGLAAGASLGASPTSSPNAPARTATETRAKNVYVVRCIFAGASA
jgi:microcystin-dependent protein